MARTPPLLHERGEYSSPAEAVGDLLGHQPVAHVKGGVHGERGDEPRLSDQPARGGQNV